MVSVAELLNQGLALTLIGMSVVFVLLTLLVGIVHAMSAFCRLVAGTAEPVADQAAANDELLGVIAAAIRHYRREQA